MRQPWQPYWDDEKGYIQPRISLTDDAIAFFQRVFMREWKLLERKEEIFRQSRLKTEYDKKRAELDKEKAALARAAFAYLSGQAKYD